MRSGAGRSTLAPQVMSRDDRRMQRVTMTKNSLRDGPHRFGLVLRTLILATLLAGLGLLAAGCGDDDAPITSIDEAIDATGDVELEGFVLVRDDEARLCDVLRESFPPQCGDPAIAIANVDAVDVELTTAEGVSWSDERVTVVGTVDSGVVTVSP